jgi:DNA helicase II / ATP-dependent DNA helicase PcrA
VRNILEFPTRFARCPVIKLTLNYRSHRNIIERYDRWMASIDWSNPNGAAFRYDKTIEPDPEGVHPEYPAVISIWGRDHRDEAQRFAALVDFLKQKGVVQDYSQIALLLHSVREHNSQAYLSALEARGIPAFCPRARAYFENPEIGLMTACFALIFGWHGDGRGQLAGATANLARYVDHNLVELAAKFAPPHPLAHQLRRWVDEIAALRTANLWTSGQPTIFTGFLPSNLFLVFEKREPSTQPGHLQPVAQYVPELLPLQHCHLSAIGSTCAFICSTASSRLLYDGGINEYEDPDRPFPKGHVQVMTIHQANSPWWWSGVSEAFRSTAIWHLFISGRASENRITLFSLSSFRRPRDRPWSPFYRRPPFEPENRITLFDRMRLHYVAFSRPQKLLVLTAHEPPKDHFAPIWQGLPQWPYVETELLAAQRFALRERMPVKKCYSFTGDLKIYETCPRQYQFFREYDFTPSRSAVIFFGLLVHQTIEDIHRMAMDGRLDTLDRDSIRAFFDRNFRFLSLSDVRPIGDAAKEGAFRQVMNYFHQNQAEMRRVIQTEVDVSLEKTATSSSARWTC